MSSEKTSLFNAHEDFVEYASQGHARHQRISTTALIKKE
jgi:hypothetical protein